MHNTLIKYINSKLATKLSDEESNLVVSVFKPKKFRKHQYLLQEGEVCKFAGFIVKGAFKQYTVEKTGEAWGNPFEGSAK
ncbi:MAG: Crp/Fnr family transcriptional regulator [Bacteroidia bacterium]|nr:Crp/Fnr family transcriptional regulator [Bacteroidia bacterium]